MRVCVRSRARVCLRVLLLPLAACLCLPPTAHAARVSATLSGGGYVPTSTLFSEGGGDGYVAFRQKTSGALGVQLTLWSASRFGLEAQAIYTQSAVEYEVDLDDGTEVLADVPADVSYGSISVLYTFYRPPLSSAVMYLTAGFGGVERGGTFYVDSGLDAASPDLGVVGGIGGHVGVARGLYLRLDARDYITSFDVESRFDTQSQHDLVLTGGLEWTVAQ